MFEIELTEKLKNEDAFDVGFCELKEHANPRLKNLPYAVSICYKLSDTVLKTIESRPSAVYFQHYRTVNAKLDLLSLSAASFIESKGYAALPVAASQSMPTSKYEGLFSHKAAARLSGLGFIGKNALLLHPIAGSKIRFATVLTDMPLTPLHPILQRDCKDCFICQKACPAGAISGKNYAEGMAREELFDAELCSNHMKTYEDIGRGAVCGICIKVCPLNQLI